MIMYCLNPQHSHPTVDVPDAEALVMIEEMINSGVSVETRTFNGVDGREVVTAFWTRDGQDGIGTLWEHTFAPAAAHGTPIGLAEESNVVQLSDRARDRESYALASDAYAVGE